MKDLVLKYREFITNTLITEEELYSNYECKIDKRYMEYLDSRDEGNKYIEELILSEMLYDFIFRQERIESDLLNATEFWYEEYSKEDSIRMYKDIQKVIKDFTIKKYEEEIRGE